MSVTGLLRRTKSLRLRRTKASSNDGDWPTIIKSRPEDDRFSNGQHIARHGVEATASPHGHSTPLSVDVLSNEDFVVAEHQHSSSDCDPMFMSTAKPNYIAHKQDSEIGLAVSSPWETAQSDLSPGIALGPTWDNFSSPGWPFLAQRNVYGNSYENEIAQPDQGQRKNDSRLPETESLSLSTTVQQTNSGTFPRRVSQEMAYTYRCPPEWEYSPPQTQEVKKTSRYGPYQNDFQRESDGPQRKKSWSRTLSRKKHKKEEIKVSVKRSQTWPLPSLPLHDSHTAPNYENTENAFLAITTNQFCPLQVEIPSVQLERYSVMFSNLIQPSDTSLLQNMGHVPPAENELPAKTGLKMAQKPDDTPAMLASRTAPVSPARASKFSLFPANSPGSGRTATTDTIPEKSIFRRPHTSTSSSIRSGSGPTKPGEQKQPISVGHRSSESPTASSFLNRHSTKLSTAYHSRSSTEDSFLSCSEFATGTSGLSRSTTANDSLPPTPSSNAGQEPASEAKTFRRVEGAPKQATEISVARQISVSTQQRHQLVPIVSKRAHRPSLPRLASVEA